MPLYDTPYARPAASRTEEPPITGSTDIHGYESGAAAAAAAEAPTIEEVGGSGASAKAPEPGAAAAGDDAAVTRTGATVVTALWACDCAAVATAGCVIGCGSGGASAARCTVLPMTATQRES